MARTAYDNSLAKHHPWAIQKSVHLAFKALPYRQTFVSNMIAKQVPAGGLNDEESCRKFLLETGLPILRQVYQITQGIYAKADMLDLPWCLPRRFLFLRNVSFMSICIVYFLVIILFA